MIFPLDVVLLGSSLRFDGTAIPVLLLVLMLQGALAWATRSSLSVSGGARLAYGLVLLGVLAQVLAGELLLYLAGSAVAGYALLALGLSAPGKLSSAHGLTAAILLVIGDLALLELVMLIAKTTPDLAFAAAAPGFEKLTGDPLAAICLVLGFGSRLALLALCLPAGWRTASNAALLPGWVLLAVSAVSGALRLACTGAPGTQCTEALVDAAWWVPALALVAWQLPRAVPRLQAAMQRVGARAAVFGQTLSTMGSRIPGGARRTLLRVARIETALTAWSAATTAATLVAVALVVTLLLASRTSSAEVRPLQPAPGIASDRPGFGDGAWVVAPGVIQAEVGATLRDSGPTRLVDASGLLRFGIDSLELRAYLPSPTLTLDPERGEIGDLGLGAKIALSATDTWRWSLVSAVFLPTGSDGVSADEASAFANIVGERALGERWSFALNAGAAAPFGKADEAKLTLIPTLTARISPAVSAYGGYAGFYADAGDEHWVEGGIAVSVGADLQWDINSAYDTANDAWFFGIGFSRRWR